MDFTVIKVKEKYTLKTLFILHPMPSTSTCLSAMQEAQLQEPGTGQTTAREREQRGWAQGGVLRVQERTVSASGVERDKNGDSLGSPLGLLSALLCFLHQSEVSALKHHLDTLAKWQQTAEGQKREKVLQRSALSTTACAPFACTRAVRRPAASPPGF